MTDPIRSKDSLVTVPGWDGPSLPLTAYRTPLLTLAAALLVLAIVCFVTRCVRGSGDLSREMHARPIPLFYQTDPRWGGEPYGDGTIADSGCGPTCLSMVACGLTQTQDWDPSAVAAFSASQGYYILGTGTSWDLMTEGAAQMGLHSESCALTAEVLRGATPSAPLICSMKPGDFTQSGHFIVVIGVDVSGRLIVNDPKSKVNSKKRWDPQHVADQVKGIWRFTLAPAEA